MSRVALLASAMFLCTPLSAQQAPHSMMMLRGPTPQIVTSAEGEARVTPDRATIFIGVQTRAATAAQASEENARKQQAVIDTIRAMGVSASQISTVNFSVYPEQSYHPEQGDKAPKIVGYNVVNTVRVEVRKLDQLGALLDATLAKGANGINSLELSASNTDEARRTALAAALARAKGDAEAMARAAGGHLGSLIEATTSSAAPPRPMARTMASAAEGFAGTPISPGEQTLQVTVTTRWHFAPGNH